MKDDKRVESKAALAPGTMNPAAGEPWEEMPVHRAGGVPYRKLFRWGWSVVSAARGWFFFGTILPMVRQLLEKYNIQVLATLITGLGGTAAMTGGFLAPFLPDHPRNRGHYLCLPDAVPHSPRFSRSAHLDLVKQPDGSQVAAAPA